MSERVLLLVGTPKGSFILDGDPARDAWSIRGPACGGWPVHDISAAPDGTLYAAAGSPWFGPAVWRSDDLGETFSTFRAVPRSANGRTYRRISSIPRAFRSPTISAMAGYGR